MKRILIWRRSRKSCKSTNKKVRNNMAREGFHDVGRRKTASARVWLFPEGKGRIIVNNKKPMEYFCREDLVNAILEPLRTTNTEGQFDIKAKIRGGGTSGQAEALRLGIAKALVKFNPEFKPQLRKSGLLTRDPRKVERKKYGQPKARKRYQYSKR